LVENKNIQSWINPEAGAGVFLESVVLH
jgi:hypothetical protein